MRRLRCVGVGDGRHFRVLRAFRRRWCRRFGTLAGGPGIVRYSLRIKGRGQRYTARRFRMRGMVEEVVGEEEQSSGVD